MSLYEAPFTLSRTDANLALNRLSTLCPEEKEQIKQHRDLLLEHLVNGTGPQPGSPLLSVQYAKPPLAPQTRDFDGEPCGEAILGLAWSTFVFVFSLLGLSNVMDKLSEDSAMPDELNDATVMSEARISVEYLEANIVGGGIKNTMKFARAYYNLFSLFWHTFGKGIIDAMKASLHWYDWAYYGAIVLAQLAASFASGGLYLIGKIVLEIGAAYNVIKGAENVTKACSNNPVLPQPSHAKSLSKSIKGGMGLLGNTTASAAEFWDEMYAFWNGIGHNGIWYTKYDGKDWSDQVSIAASVENMKVHNNSSPASCYFQGKLYVFWNQGVDSYQSNVSYCTFDGEKWSEMSELEVDSQYQIVNDSSPSCCQYQDKLYVFWGANWQDSIVCSVYDGQSWQNVYKEFATAQNALPRTPGSSPCVTVHQDKIYLFWSHWNVYEICYFVFDGDSWSEQFSWANMLLLGDSFPSALTFEDKLILFSNNRNNDDIAFRTYDGKKWSNEASISSLIGGLWLMDGSSPASFKYKNTMYVFWNGVGRNGLWFAEFKAGSLKNG